MQDDAFLTAILADPDDDAPRLIYADWLDEQGRPERAEFIRVQCDLARRPEGDSRRGELQARERALLAVHEKDWAAPLVGLVLRWTFYRGFVWGVTLQPRQFLSHADTLFGLAPVRAVTFYSGREAMPVPDLASCPSLRRLSWVAFQGAYLPGGGDVQGTPQTLAEGYDTRIGDAGVEVLAASPYVDQLTALILSGNGITSRGAQALAASAHLANLYWLDLQGNDIGGSAFQALGRAASRWLGLGGAGTPGAGVQALINSPYLGRLRHLDLRKNNLSAEDRQALRQRFGDCVHV
jgi:uncharacterized protein (TIGR02996 family)